ncbi:MAG: 30S ribosomal protein S12 methylthiotransferase RimO [bacterium]
MSRPGPTVYCATLGCDKNLVDSEALLGFFTAHGCRLVEQVHEAEILVLNSCGFIAAARQDSHDTLQALLAEKQPEQFLVVMGCWSQEHAAEISAAFPAVDLVAGVGDFERVVEACLAGSRKTLLQQVEQVRYDGFTARLLLTPSHVAFVKIGEGCDGKCTFCRIPLIRGCQRSRTCEDIVTEVRQLVAGGVTEIQLVSQNSGAFGRDTGEDLLTLVSRLDGVDGLHWIRLLYLYPGMLPVATVLRILALPKVVSYLDMPIQHASPGLLRAMKRPGDVESSARYFEALRREYPDLVLRTTLLLGFPGEEEEDLELLADFLQRVEFDHLGTYRYSAEAGTAAASLPNQVSSEEVADREALILDIQADLAQQRQERRLGRQFELVVDEVVPVATRDVLLQSLAAGHWVRNRERDSLTTVLQTESEVALGRSEHYGYDLDGVVALPVAGLSPGRRVQVRFLAATPFDIWATAEVQT